MATGSNLRVGDAEREAVAAQLRDHYADGRLTMDELNERLDQAFAAKTQADLRTVTRDLPATARPLASAPTAGYGVNAWQDATGSGHRNWDETGHQRHRPAFAAFALMMAMFWVCAIVGGLFVFGLGGARPIGVVLLLAALAWLRRLIGGRRRGGGRGRSRRR
jgi:Domain of unknown function (DUF1707)